MHLELIQRPIGTVIHEGTVGERIVWMRAKTKKCKCSNLSRHQRCAKLIVTE